MKTHDAARSTLDMTSPRFRSIPVSITPTRAPLPLLTAYEPDVVALIARISHWHGPSGSGPVIADTLYSDAQAAISTACERVPSGTAAVFAPTRAKPAFRAAPTLALDPCTAVSKRALADATDAIPTLFMLRIAPPAASIAPTAASGRLWSTRTMYSALDAALVFTPKVSVD